MQALHYSLEATTLEVNGHPKLDTNDNFLVSGNKMKKH